MSLWCSEKWWHRAVCRRNELKLSLRCSYMRWLNSLLRLTAAERGSLPPPLCWLWCLCNCTASWSNLLMHEKTNLTEKVNSFLLSWRTVPVLSARNPEVAPGDEQGAELEGVSCVASAGTLPCSPGRLLGGLSLAMSLSSMSVPPKWYCLVPYQEHLVSAVLVERLTSLEIT